MTDARVTTAPYVIYQCEAHMLASSTDEIDRLLLKDEASVESTAEGVVLRERGVVYAAWNLGAMLGMRPSAGAFLLLGLGAGRQVRLALEVDACLLVTPLAAYSEIPSAVFARRPRAVRAAFRRSAAMPNVPCGIGFVLDPHHLWTDEELSRSRALLRTRSIDAVA
jgi:hypothetical protein